MLLFVKKASRITKQPKQRKVRAEAAGAATPAQAFNYEEFARLARDSAGANYL